MKEGRQTKTNLFDQQGLAAFVEQLKKIRAAKNLSQKKLAEKSGISMSIIARIETLKINPTLSTIFALTRAMNVPISEMFDFKLPK